MISFHAKKKKKLEVSRLILSLIPALIPTYHFQEAQIQILVNCTWVELHMMCYCHKLNLVQIYSNEMELLLADEDLLYFFLLEM